MDKKKLLMMGAALVALSPFTVQEAAAATAAVNVQARVLDPIQLSITNTALDFGTFSITGAGSVVISDGCLPTCAGGGAGYNMAGVASPNAAALEIKATKGFALLVDASAGTGATISNGATTMAIASVDLEGDTDADAIATVTIAGGPGGLGTTVLGIGATLTLGGAEGPGLYVGSFVVDVSYN